MQIHQVDIHRVRNLSNVSLQPAAGLNLIYGSNASGKTSILEAIYLLSHGRSFRTANIRSVIQHQTESLQVFGKIKQNQSKTFIQLGLERGPVRTNIRINQNTVTTTSQLAAYLPVQIINPEAHRLLEHGPSQRRKFLDWGLFHVEPRFHPTWQNYNRLLKQRNAALRQKIDKKNITAWDPQLLETADTLTLLRRQYVADLLPYIQNYTNRLLDIALDIQYRPGWNQEQDFKTALDEDFEQDRMQGHTRKGPHRADLRLTEHGITVQDKFSRGQQKLLVCALRLAQIKHLKDQLEQSSVVLVDDLAAELDTYHRAQLLTLLAESGAQLFITATEMNLITTGGWSSQKVFHVEHGQIVEVV
jgi:DNA replication and repair protein RecF